MTRPVGHAEPVNAAARPSAVTIPSWRVSRSASSARTRASASSASAPAASSTSARSPEDRDAGGLCREAPSPPVPTGRPSRPRSTAIAPRTRPLLPPGRRRRSRRFRLYASVIVAFTVGANLLTVPAALHRAPRPRAVPGRVDEGPAAVVGTARLHTLPRAVGHPARDLGDDSPDRAAHAAYRGSSRARRRRSERRSARAARRRPAPPSQRRRRPRARSARTGGRGSPPARGSLPRAPRAGPRARCQRPRAASHRESAAGERAPPCRPQVDGVHEVDHELSVHTSLLALVVT